ncbi:MAG: NADPH-dependent FMN reductase [Flavitalea sp.]
MPMKDKYLIISGTNRKGSNSLKVAYTYSRFLEEQGVESTVISLEDFNFTTRSPEFLQFEQKYLLPATKMIFIVPEYNGSFPGILKIMFDISDYKTVWKYKKALLVGISTGRSGNVRGLEHLTSILNYLLVVVHPFKLPISSIHNLISESNELEDSATLNTISGQVRDFINF